LTFKDFIANYDKPGAIVLLEGKRKVPEDEKERLIELGKLLTQNTSNMVFRSGNASGADEYFSLGVAEIDPKRLEVLTPYSGHRKKYNKAYHTTSLDEVDLAMEPEVVYQSKKNKKTEKLVDRFVAGDKDRYAIKAAYILRDTIKVIGAEGISPASFAIFYDDLKNPMAGGTGHTMNVCREKDVQFINQATWFKWITK